MSWCVSLERPHVTDCLSLRRETADCLTPGITGIDLRGNVLVQTWHDRKVYKSNVIWILGQKHQAFSTLVARITWCSLGRYAVDLQCIIKSSTTVMLICHKRGHLHICECVLYIFYPNYFFYYFYFDLFFKKASQAPAFSILFLFCLL